MNKNIIKQYVCINCGQPAKELFKKFSTSVKVVRCDKCNLIVDKYIEFEPVVILIDSVLLSETAFRHILFNQDFKLHWKLSLVLLLLESFALWRHKRQDIGLKDDVDMVHEKGFYICCLQNIIDNLILFTLLFTCTVFVQKNSVNLKSAINLYKGITIANFSKFFLLPIMIWRDNTTEFGANVHYFLVMGHYLLSSIFVYSVVSRLSKTRSALIVLSLFAFKEYIKAGISMYTVNNLAK
ncbi:protein ARV1 [Episyrphus balteatus]|uniref:protein ARV1 n=1 Tax=Episyrphus balteatus TaxID=286459 RepID=UPI002486C7A8|nr:protein ARV1 [Episyrphus balteatus]